MALAGNTLALALDTGTWTAFRGGQRVAARDLKIGPNSVNVSLHRKIYRIVPRRKRWWHLWGTIDLHDAGSFRKIELSCADGLTLKPWHFYLGAVRESFDCDSPLLIKKGAVSWVSNGKARTNTLNTHHYFYPVIDGRSTTGRVSISTHQTAGRGDYGFGSGMSRGATFTLELSCRLPVRIYAGDHIGQVYFEPIEGAPEKYRGAYQQQGDGPVPAAIGADRF